MILVPKNWSSFQHYKDRNPPWIKLHKSLLNDRSFMCLPLASKALAPMLWLLASESKDGDFDASIDELEFRLRMSRKDLEIGLKSLIDSGFFIVASGMLAERLQVAPESCSETETEAERETETKARKLASPDGVSPSVWQDFLQLRKTKKAPVTQSAIDGIKREATKAGWDLETALQEICSRGWTGFKADWVAEAAKPVQQITTPGRQGIDPALQKLENDKRTAAPLPAEIRQKIASLTRKVG